MFESLKLMTLEERNALFTLNIHTCANAIPDNVHQSLKYMSRLMRKSPERIISIFERLDCLSFKMLISKQICDHEDVSKSDVIAVSYSPSLVDVDNCDEIGTLAMNAIFKCISENLCPECSKNAIKHLDLSVLSSKAGVKDSISSR